MNTGYWGVPGKSSRSKVHIEYSGKALCGWKPSKKNEFQWNSHGVQVQYLECKSCKKLAWLHEILFEKV